MAHLLITPRSEQWDAFVEANGGNFLQSWGWSEFQEALGRRVFRSAIADGSRDAAIAQFLLISHRLPFGARYGYVPHGPIVSDGAKSDHFTSAVRAIEELSRNEDFIFTRIEPLFAAADGTGTAENLTDLGFKRAAPVQPSDTLIVDLGKSEEELLSEMHHKTRYNLRLAERRGVTVRRASRGDARNFRRDLDSFRRLLDETARRDGFRPHPAAYYEKMLEVLPPEKGGALQVELFFAEQGSEPLAAVLSAEFGGIATYLHGASANTRRDVMAPYLLHWRIMTEAKQRGFGQYDFWGVAPDDDPSHSWAGITRFKRGFGGRRVSRVGAWELPISRLRYNLYRWTKNLRNFLTHP